MSAKSLLSICVVAWAEIGLSLYFEALMLPCVSGCSIFERFRRVATEGTVDQRLTMLIENFFTRMVQSKGIENMDNPSIPPGLDFVEVEEQITHNVDLEQPTNAKPGLDVFRFDPEFQEHEAEYKVSTRIFLPSFTYVISASLFQVSGDLASFSFLTFLHNVSCVFW